MARKPVEVHIHNCGTVNTSSIIVNSKYILIGSIDLSPVNPVIVQFIMKDGTTSDDVYVGSTFVVGFDEFIYKVRIRNLATGTNMRVVYSNMIDYIGGV